MQHWRTSTRRQGLRAITSDLRNRLLVLLVVPLGVLVVGGVWLDYRSAGAAAGQHDQRLLRLLPALADSVLAPPLHADDPPLLLLAPPIEDFLRQIRIVLVLVVDAAQRGGRLPIPGFEG